MCHMHGHGCDHEHGCEYSHTEYRTNRVVGIGKGGGDKYSGGDSWGPDCGMFDTGVVGTS